MRAKRATLRFFADLAELAPDADRNGEITVTFDVPRSVKDAIESCGVPHTEVDLVLVNGRSVGFAARLSDGDHVSVYPKFVSVDPQTVSRVRPTPLPEHRFVCDVHLGRLARHLRLLGFDTRYSSDADDPTLADVAERENRWLLTRDRGLLMRDRVTHGYLVRHEDPREQIVEVSRRFEVADDMRPFTRCLTCNGRLESVDKARVVDELEPGTRERHDDFVRCAGCGQLYWEGSHHEDLSRLVEEVRARA